jgi:peptidoglycan/LPS O-acetylase OafA/YrhL
MKPYAPALPSHIPSLDGLRALSIVLVLAAHLDGTRRFPFHTGMVLGDVGNLGVRIFFVISGFLITTLLLKEFDRTDTISLRNFYLRRTLRIFPAFYVFAFSIGLAVMAGWITLLPGDLLHGLTYTMNYHVPHGWYMGHIWSLSVEEQFYLLWPCTMLLAGPRRARWICLIAIIAPPVLRIVGLFLVGAGLNTYQFHLVADAIATGCLFSILYNRLGASERYLRFIRSSTFLLVLGLGLLVFIFSRSTRLYFAFGITILNLCIALCIDRYVRFPGTAVGRVLNSRPLRGIGLLSYSLYLWQQPFLNRHTASLFTTFPVNLVMVGLCAAVSYYLIEQPIRRYGYRKLDRRQAVANADTGNAAAAPFGI